jgi:hypothetical protein
MKTHFIDYPVKDSDVSLRVTIGEAQAGATSVFLGRDQMAGGPQAWALGAGTALRGKILVVSTVVVDVRPETDRTSVTLQLKNGDSESSWTDTENAPTGGAVPYLFVVSFV